MASGLITSFQINGEIIETVIDFIFGASKSLQMVTVTMKFKTLAPWKKTYEKPRQHIKNLRHYFDNKSPTSHSYGFPSSHVWI